MKISDEIRNDFLYNDDLGDVAYRQLLCIADRIDRETMENEHLKKENAELKAELADWNGNAPDAYMKLPLDADGEPIRIGDEVTIDGAAKTVLGYRLYDDVILLIANDENGLIFAHEPSRVRHLKQAPADSWEKLEEDVNLGCRDYCKKHRLEECDYNMNMHLLARAKKLAGAEDEVI